MRSFQPFLIDELSSIGQDILSAVHTYNSSRSQRDDVGHRLDLAIEIAIKRLEIVQERVDHAPSHYILAKQEGLIEQI